MKAKTDGKTIEMRKRLTAILVAVVFVLGTTFIPSQIYAVEPDNQETVGTEAVEPEAVNDENNNADETVGHEASTADPDATEPETAETVETETPAEEDTENEKSDLSELVVITDENGNPMDIDEIDESQYDGFIYKLTEDATKSEIKEMENAIDNLDADQNVGEVISNELYSADSIETISEVVDPETIEYIEPNYILHAFDVPDDPEYIDYSWQLVNTKVPDVWDMGAFGAGAIVAVLDTGVNKNCPDLMNASFVNDYNACTKKYEDSIDDNGHGTKVTGIIAETRNNGIGFTGAMPNVSIMPVKVLDSTGRGGLDTIILGINKAIEKKAHVINMSFGGTISGANSISLENACKRAVDSGVILVAAAGNEAKPEYGNPLEYPAAYDCVVSVGSVNKYNKWSSFSNYNNKVTVVAPGEGVCVINGASSYRPDSGTSFAAPQVSALAAMVKSYKPGISPKRFIHMLKNTSTDLGNPGYDIYYGYGLINYANVFKYMDIIINNCSMKLTASVYDYDGGVKSPAAIVSSGTYKLANGIEYTVSYAADRKNVGTYAVTINGMDDCSGTKTTKFIIRPPLVKAIKKPKGEKKKLTVSWKAMKKSQKKKYGKGITGYQVRLSISSDFSNSKYVNIKGLSKTKVTIKNLKKKTKYYVQYRSYKTVGGTTYYSKWSAVKTAKTK